MVRVAASSLTGDKLTAILDHKPAKMPKIKTYSLLNFKFVFGSIFILFIILFFSLMLYGNLKILSGFWNGNSKTGYFGVFLLVLNGYLFSYLGLVVYQFMRYFWHERNTKIEIDLINETIILNRNSKTYIVSSENLNFVEFHLSTKHYKNLLRNFGYTKLICREREFIITNFILDYPLIENMFPTVKKIKKLDEIIYIPQNCS